MLRLARMGARAPGNANDQGRMETRLQLSNRPAVRRYAATRELADQGQRADCAADPVRRSRRTGAGRELREGGLRGAGIGLASAARQCPSELAHCLLMLLVPDLGKVAGDLEQHTLMG